MKERPRRKHFMKKLKSWRSAWICSTDELVVSICNGAFESVVNQETFESWYPLELCIKYGLNKDLIVIKKSDNDGYHDVFFTDKGLKIAQALAKRTCAFSGRATSGVF